MFQPLHNLGRRREIMMLVPVALLAIAALVVVGCTGSATTTTGVSGETTAGGGNATTTSGGTAETTAGAGSVTTARENTPITAGPGGFYGVMIEDLAFSPSSVTVKVGQTIVWGNADAVAHTIVADDGSFKSGNLEQDASYEFTFKTAGTYTYKCSIHPEMTGTVIVQ